MSELANNGILDQVQDDVDGGRSMKIAAVILAAGKGTRMNEGSSSPIPKVMFKVNGKPIVRYGVDLLKNAGIEKIVLVVGYKNEMVEDYLGSEVEYVVQREQLGTGHATAQSKDTLQGEADAVIVYYGDHVLWRPESVRMLIDTYKNEAPTIAMLSVKTTDPNHWAFGRVVRNEEGKVEAIVEQKDCNSDQLKITECNPGFYLFNADWLWENIENLKNDNAQKEYYLTDLIKMAKEQNKDVIAVPVVDELEAFGINTQEHLKEAEEILKSRENV